MHEILARVGSNEIPRLFYLQQRVKRMHRTLIALMKSQTDAPNFYSLMKSQAGAPNSYSLMKSQTGAPNFYSFNEESNGRILSF